jgi:hypothetical protein
MRVSLYLASANLEVHLGNPGQYSFWSYLHVYYNSANIGSTALTFANDLSSQLSTDTATGAILSSNVQVTRYNDGGGITPNY